ncbi:MAG: SLC13 family permease [Nitrososphaeria archaeon]|nr:SLC13 family permease [Nitrososphaeria archaeon]
MARANEIFKKLPILNVTVVILSTLFIAGLASLFNFSFNQNVALTIFSFKTAAALMFWRYRLPFATFGLALLFLFGVLDVPHMVEFASLDIVLFLIGMMIIIGFLEEKGFFEYLSLGFLKFAGLEGKRIVVAIMVFSALSAALIDEVTSILIMVSLIFRIASKCKISTIPLILMSVFATNIGSAATVVGNPVGVLIAFRGGLSFLDFIRWSTPICIIALLVIILICFKYFSKYISKLDSSLKYEKEIFSKPSEEYSMTPRDLIVSWLIFLITLGLLILHHPLEEFFHLKKNTLLLGIPLLMASIVLVLEPQKAKYLVERRVDWWTLLFFIMLFASVGTLQYVGVIDILAKGLINLAGNNLLTLALLFIPVIGLLSAMLDNVLVVATFSPVVIEIGAIGINNFPLWWIMLHSACFIGNLTVIGSTANIVAAGACERKGDHISLLEWVKIGALVSVPTILVSFILIYVQLIM